MRVKDKASPSWKSIPVDAGSTKSQLEWKRIFISRVMETAYSLFEKIVTKPSFIHSDTNLLGLHLAVFGPRPFIGDIRNRKASIVVWDGLGK